MATAIQQFSQATTPALMAAPTTLNLTPVVPAAATLAVAPTLKPPGTA